MNTELISQRTFFLSVVPHKYLLGILKNKKLTVDQLRSKYQKFSGIKVENPKSVIKNLPQYKLIEFLIKSEILQ